MYPEGLPPDIKLPLGIGVHVIWLVLPLAVWAGVLLLRPGISDAKRFTFFLVGTGLVLTLMVEVIVVSGDIGRMNTVFKFYLHVWSLFSVSSAAIIIWMWQSSISMETSLALDLADWSGILYRFNAVLPPYGYFRPNNRSHVP